MAAFPHRAPLAGVQALRGLAAMAVLAHHLAIYGHEAFGERVLPHGPALGWIGVDVFFVLSGLIMVHTAWSAAPTLHSVGRFWAARAARIYPTYWAASLAAIGLAAAYPSILPTGRAMAPIWTQIVLAPAGDYPLIGPAWTLVFEISFYIVFGLILLAPPAHRAALLAIWAATIIALAVSLRRPPNPFFEVYAGPLALEFLAGAAIGLALQRGVRAPFWLAPLAVLAIAGGALLYWRLTPTLAGYDLAVARALLVGAPAAILVFAVASWDFAAKPAPPRWLHGLGDRSYALYLVHWPIVVVAAPSLAAVGSGWGLKAAFLFGCLAASLAATEALHRLIERPTLAWSRRALR
jgi:peptidoglycan/LPS O-acetylase OafA/YrhL